LRSAATRWPVFAQQAPPNRPFEPTPFQEGACLAFGATETARNSADRRDAFHRHATGFPLTHPLGHDARTPPETAARGFLSACGSMFGLTGDASELSLERASTADDQRSIVRFQQMSGGVPGVRRRDHRAPRSQSQRHHDGRQDPAEGGRAARAQITAQDASRAAIEAIAKVHGVPSRNLSAAAPQLWVYDQSLIGPGARFAPGVAD
jgi:hypothetical protein